jgi:hypothetical protein
MVLLWIWECVRKALRGTVSRGAAAAAAAALAAEMRLAPANSNPFVAHPLPMQEGRRLLAEGRVGDASLAFEAAVQVARPGDTPAYVLRLFASLQLDIFGFAVMLRAEAEPADMPLYRRLLCMTTALCVLRP